MDNVRKIRKEKGLYFILEHGKSDGSHNGRIAVFVNLYYPDMVEYCLKYLLRLDQKIDIFIASSNKDVLSKADSYISWHGTKNIRLLEKNNRGRDVSALLVTFRHIALQYDFFCFIHDKKEKKIERKADVDLWVRNLWENTLASQHYVNNVMSVFEKNPQIGLLVPPEPIGEDTHTWYTNSWDLNFEHTTDLANRLKLNCNISYENAPITIGTAFWSRSLALRKLLEIDWKFDDFMPEPLPVDGTLSHAVERIFAYVAQDAGYDTGTIMTVPYAAQELAIAQEQMYKSYQILDRYFGIRSLKTLVRLDVNQERIISFCREHPIALLYGAGKIAQSALAILGLLGFVPQGFLVTDKRTSPKDIRGIPVMGIDELVFQEGMGIIISVNSGLQEQIIAELEKRGITEYLTLA